MCLQDSGTVERRQRMVLLGGTFASPGIRCAHNAGLVGALVIQAWQGGGGVTPFRWRTLAIGLLRVAPNWCRDGFVVIILVRPTSALDFIVSGRVRIFTVGRLLFSNDNGFQHIGR